MNGVTVLGATGSIGSSTLDVLARYPQRYQVKALTAFRDVEAMTRLCRHWQPGYAVMADADAADTLQQVLGKQNIATRVLAGVEGLEQVASLPDVDIVMAAIVGAAGLHPTLAAVRAGKRVLLANKEVLVMSGQLFMEEVHAHGAQLLPIDSEHNAVFQCLPGDFASGLTAVGVRRILLTASGGPFRTLSLADLHEVTPEQACAHPNWSMGRKISVDSATMLNKGLEVIEACWLFNATPGQVDVVLHPQSIIHSMVEYADGSLLAQMGCADMRIPITHALAWPQRMESGAERLNLFDVARLDFEAPDLQRFACLRLAYEAIEQGGTAPAVLNAANEVAVAAFLDRRLRFSDIPVVIEKVLTAMPARDAADLASILDEDAAARDLAVGCITDLTGK